MSNKKAVDLLNQIIEQSEYQDYLDKRMVEAIEGAPTSGESWITFHLKSLRELLQNNSDSDKSK